MRVRRVDGKESKENISPILETVSLKYLTYIQMVILVYTVTGWIYI